LGSVKDTVSTSSIQRFSPRFPPSKSAKVQVGDTGKNVTVKARIDIALRSELCRAEPDHPIGEELSFERAGTRNLEFR